MERIAEQSSWTAIQRICEIIATTHAPESIRAIYLDQAYEAIGDYIRESQRTVLEKMLDDFGTKCDCGCGQPSSETAITIAGRS